MNIKRIVCIALAAFLPAGGAAVCQSFNQSVELVDIPLLYETDGHPDHGFFSEIHSISMDEKKRVLYVLHDTPAILSSFNGEDGLPLDKRDFAARVEPPARAEACAGKIWIIVNRRLMLLGDDNSLVPPAPGGAELPAADFAECSPTGELLAVDAKKKELFTIPKDGAPRQIDASALDPKKHPSPKKLFASITGVAFGPLNRLYVLDRDGGVIRSIDYAGRLLSSILLASPSGAHVPWKVSSIAADSADRIWAVNTTENSLDVYDSFGALIYRVRDMPADGGGFRFTRPAEILIDNDGRLFLSDTGSAKIAVFDISRLP